MDGILKGTARTSKVPAFVAAPLGGTTLVQLGADDHPCRPSPAGSRPSTAGRLTLDGKHSLFWAGLQSWASASIAVDFRKPRGQELS